MSWISNDFPHPSSCSEEGLWLSSCRLFLRFGVKTTLIQRSKQLLSGFDEDVASPLQQALEEEGMQIYTHTRLLSAS